MRAAQPGVMEWKGNGALKERRKVGALFRQFWAVNYICALAGRDVFSDLRTDIHSKSPSLRPIDDFVALFANGHAMAGAVVRIASVLVYYWVEHHDYIVVGKLVARRVGRVKFDIRDFQYTAISSRSIAAEKP